MIVVTATGAAGHLLGSLLRVGSGGALSVLCAETSAAAFSGDGPDFILLSEQSFSHIECENAAFIIRGKDCIPSQILCPNAVAIVDSSDSANMEQVSLRRLRALTCGLSISDTFTLSSLTADSAVIALQRPVTAFDGSITEPFELPVLFHSRVEPFLLLACAAVFCLSGQKNPLASLKSWKLPPARSTVEIGFARRI